MRLFLDTNVWIDFLAERQPFYPAAATLLSLADDGRCEIVISSLSMVTACFVCCERGHMPLKTWKQKVNNLRNLIKICAVGADDIYSANDADWKDFEDSVQYYAAANYKCEIIVTRNIKDFSKSQIKVVTPDEAIDIING